MKADEAALVSALVSKLRASAESATTHDPNVVGQPFESSVLAPWVSSLIDAAHPRFQTATEAPPYEALKLEIGPSSQKYVATGPKAVNIPTLVFAAASIAGAVVKAVDEVRTGNWPGLIITGLGAAKLLGGFLAACSCELSDEQIVVVEALLQVHPTELALEEVAPSVDRDSVLRALESMRTLGVVESSDGKWRFATTYHVTFG